MLRATKQIRFPLLVWLCGCFALLAGNLDHVAIAADDPQHIQISIIIDDMGDNQNAGINALQLPGPITYAFLPHAPHSQSQAWAAHHLGKEVMLHLPMQAMDSNERLGPGSLKLDMGRTQFSNTFRASLASVPFVAGINNHMGSLLTRHPGHMRWLMEELNQQQNLYFIDSRTTHHTVAIQLASEMNVSSRQRDVFLDDDPSPTAITYQFNRLLRKAMKQGSAIGIGHPHESTITILRQQIPLLYNKGIELVPVSQLVTKASQTQMANVTKEKTPESLVLNHHTESHNH